MSSSKRKQIALTSDSMFIVWTRFINMLACDNITPLFGICIFTGGDFPPGTPSIIPVYAKHLRQDMVSRCMPRSLQEYFMGLGNTAAPTARTPHENACIICNALPFHGLEGFSQTFKHQSALPVAVPATLRTVVGPPACQQGAW